MTINKEELFLSKNGEIKILKFSPSRLDSIMPSAGCSDIGAIYSASCMLYEFFTNETPFQGPRTHAEQERAHLLAVLRVRSDKTCQDVYERIADLFLSGVTKNADKRVNVLEKFAAECERLWSDAIAIQEGLDDIEAREQLNSAFDVVAMLKGSGSEPQTKAVENEYSRVWRGMELKKKFNPDTETVFRWIAVSAIALSFGYRFFY
jgi:serine/threonine protein kinase